MFNSTMLPPTWVITMTAASCAFFQAQLHGFAESVHCINATRAADVSMRGGVARHLPSGVVVQVLSPPVHPAFTLRELEVGARASSAPAPALAAGGRATDPGPCGHLRLSRERRLGAPAAQVAILLSHLRAVSAGSSVGGPFLVLEEDVDLGLLLAASSNRVHVLLDGLPPGWHVLQASVRLARASRAP